MGRRGRGGKQGGKGGEYAGPPGYQGQTSGKGGGDGSGYAGLSGYAPSPSPASKGDIMRGPPGSLGASGPPGVFAGPPGNFTPAEMQPPGRQDMNFQPSVGRGMPPPGALGGNARRPPLTLQLAEGTDVGPSAIEAEMPPHLWPITPLGLPRTPPPLPPVPNDMRSPAFFPSLAPSVEEPDSYSTFTIPEAPTLSLPTASTSSQAVVEPPEEEWTPVAERMAKMDRRTFFHTEGKPLAFDPSKPFRRPVNASERCNIGEDVDLKVEEVHFGNPRIKISTNDPAQMPVMLKWPVEKLDEFVLDCAQIDFGEYRAWAAVGIRSNRLLYALKRSSAVMLKATVVPPPVVEAEDDVDLTYGASIQGIQLVP